MRPGSGPACRVNALSSSTPDRSQRLRGLGALSSGAACQFTPSIVLSAVLAAAGVAPSLAQPGRPGVILEDRGHARIGLPRLHCAADQLVGRHRRHHARQHRRRLLRDLEALPDEGKAAGPAIAWVDRPLPGLCPAGWLGDLFAFVEGAEHDDTALPPKDTTDVMRLQL